MGLFIRVTAAEKELLSEAAKKDSHSLCAFIRKRIGLQSTRDTDPRRPLVSNDWNQAAIQVPTSGTPFAYRWAEIIDAGKAAGITPASALRDVVRAVVTTLNGDGSGPITFEQVVGGSLAAELEAAAKVAGFDPVWLREQLLRTFDDRMKKAAGR